MRKPKPSKDMIPGSTHVVGEYGEAVVIDYQSSEKVKIKFKETGTEIFVQAGNLRRGVSIKDRNKRTVQGVGYIGYGDHAACVNGEATKKYSVWSGMFRRCYAKESLDKRPTYKGCYVCDEWHNFQVFSEWFDENYPDDGGSYEIDKDIIIDGNKVYSPDTCMFVTPQENTEKACAKIHTLLSPNGEIIEVYNMMRFCRENGLLDHCLRKVRLGKIPHHRGWKLLGSRSY